MSINEARENLGQGGRIERSSMVEKNSISQQKKDFSLFADKHKPDKTPEDVRNWARQDKLYKKTHIGKEDRLKIVGELIKYQKDQGHYFTEPEAEKILKDIELRGQGPHKDFSEKKRWAMKSIIKEMLGKKHN